MIDRHEYHPIGLEEAATLGKGWVCQLKIDGVWALATHNGRGVVVITGRRGRELAQIRIPARAPAFVLVGEWMADHDRFYVFDLISERGTLRTGESFETRARHARFICAAYRVSAIGWVKYESHDKTRRSFEASKGIRISDGIVMKRLGAAYNEIGCQHYKVKHSVTMDYVVTRIIYTKGGTRDGEANGVQGALYLDGTLYDVCKIPNLPYKWRRKMQADPSAFVGRVVEARGQKVFPSGALRHPAFNRWRDDKPATDCIKPA